MLASTLSDPGRAEKRRPSSGPTGRTALRHATDATLPRPHCLTCAVVVCSLLALWLPLVGLFQAGVASAAGLGVGTGQTATSAVLGRRDDPLQFDPIIMTDNASIFLLVNMYD